MELSTKVFTIKAQAALRNMVADSKEKQIQTLPKKTNAKTFNQELKKATKSFEELFVHNLIKEMRKSVPKNDLLGGGAGEEIFRDMLDEKYSEKIVENGGIGLSDFMYRQLER